MVDKLMYLKQLEVESIYIICEVVVEFDNLVMLYLIGKDFVVMLYLVCKVFFFGKLFFLVMYVDICWKFQEMYRFCDWMVEEMGLDLIIYVNLDGVVQGINLFIYGSVKYIDVMKIEGFKQVLDKYGFDVVFGGVCCDEEKLWVKEWVYLFCDSKYCWDLKNQCFELWNIYNGKVKKGELICVFLLFNWIELDIW